MQAALLLENNNRAGLLPCLPIFTGLEESDMLMTLYSYVYHLLERKKNVTCYK